MKKFIISNLLMSLLLTVDAHCMMRKASFEALFPVFAYRFFSTTTVNLKPKNPYNVLKVDQNATPKEIKTAYHKLVKVVHPNVFGGTSDAFCRVKEAYDALRKKQNDYLFLNRFNVLYSDSLVIDSDLKEFSEFVSKEGFNKKIIQQDSIPYIIDMPKNYVAPKLNIKKINNTVGYGVFAKEIIKKGSLIKQYTGKVILIDNQECENNKYLFYVCNKDKDLVIDAQYVGNESRFFNHSYFPNCFIRPVYSPVSSEFIQYWIVADKDILPGEEILWNYSSGYWRTQGIVPREKDVRHIYQDEDVTVYSFPKNGLSKIFVNDYSLAINDIDTKNCRHMIFSEIFGSKYIKTEKNVFLFIATKQNDKIIPIILIKKETDFNFSLNLSNYPKEVLTLFYKWAATLQK